jgi:2,3-bisphosphoglycerate-dependent phosphoglycerate mutase
MKQPLIQGMEMIEIWLVRHAQSQNNAGPESERQPDPALTPLGKWQADAVAQHLHAAGPFEWRYVSAFRRALETAEPFHHGATPAAKGFRIWTDIFEVGGCFAGYAPHPRKAEPGLTIMEVQQRFPWASPPPDWTTGGWNQLTEHESMEAAIPRADRVKETLQRMAAEVHARRTSPSGENIEKVLMVSHGEFIALLLARLLTGEPNYFVRPRSIYNTSITKIRLASDNKCRLLELNQIAHLSPGAISS